MTNTRWPAGCRQLHPAALGRELQQLAQGLAAYITHIKPSELVAVMGKFIALCSGHGVMALVAGQLMAAV